MKKRSARMRRTTRETDITVDMCLDGKGEYRINTGMAFLDHMLELLSRHSLINLRVTAKGDLDVDYHHTVEDIGLAMGDALNKALGKRIGIRRYGWSIVPMDEALSQVAIDLGGRPYLVYKMATRKKKILDFDIGLIEEFFRAFTVQGRLNMHVWQMYGKEPHHACECVFKAVGKALRMACCPDERLKGLLPSTKGRI
jgi:imidazoleglycerol-phosphate dehydratase